MNDISGSSFITGWKDIAKYMNMGVRTVQRYECENKLPIRRPAGGATGAVIATRVELDQWVAARPRHELTPAKQSPSADSALAALQAGMLRMRELRKEMSQRRAEMRATISALHGSIRVVDAASVRLLRSIEVGTAATQKERASVD